MFVSDSLHVNNLGHLTIGQRDAVELAETFGTPLYVMDEEQIRKNCRRFKDSMEQYYGGKGQVAYASKAFCCKAMCAVVAEEGMALDVVSGGELFTAMSAGFPPEDILFHGNNKTFDDLIYAVQCGVGRIVVDNMFELEMLNQVAASMNRKQRIQFRIKPGIDAHTHDFVQTGQIDSKFGFALETGEAFKAVEAASKLENLHLAGIHCHIGSQIFDIHPFEAAAQTMLGLVAQVKESLGMELEELNLGGGFGIRYLPEEHPAEYEKYMMEVSQVVKKTCSELGLKTPFIIIEPGRSIVGSAGVTLYRVGGIKEIPGIRTYLSVDGGMTDNPRYALYGSQYDMLIANKAGEQKNKSYTIAGRCCESGDLLGRDIPLQQASVGDTLAVLATGAYNYSMASNYNRLPKPAVVFVHGSEAQVVVRRQSFEDVMASDV